MSLHAAKTPVTNPEDCLALVPQHEVLPVADEEESHHKEALWDYEQGYKAAIAAAKAAGE